MRAGDIEVNGKKYTISAIYVASQKARNESLGLDVRLRIIVVNLADDKAMEWKEIKNTYLQEKVEDYIKNCINGQRSCYWDYSKEGENE